MNTCNTSVNHVYCGVLVVLALIDCWFTQYVLYATKKEERDNRNINSSNIEALLASLIHSTSPFPHDSPWLHSFFHFQYNGYVGGLFCFFHSVIASNARWLFSLLPQQSVCCNLYTFICMSVCPSRSTSSPFTISNLESVPVMAFSIISYYLIAFELCRRAGGCRLLNVLMLFALFSVVVCVSTNNFLHHLIFSFPLFLVPYVFRLLYSKRWNRKNDNGQIIWGWLFMCTCSYIARMMMMTMMILMMMPIKN